MKRVLGLTVVAAAVALAVVVGQRMSTDAMAVVIGVVFGVAASIPTSLLVVAATRGRREEPRGRRAAPFVQRAPQPQIYVVTPGAAPASQPWLNGGQAQQQLPGPPPGYFGSQQPVRRFKVVGEDESWLEASAWDDEG